MVSSGRRGTNKTLTMVERGGGSEHGGGSSARVRDGGHTSGARRAAWIVAGFLAIFTPFNVYWGFGGKWGVSWVLGCEDCLPLLAVWVQQVALIAGIAVVLGRAGVWRPPLLNWVLRAGAWGMAACFGAIALWNLVGDNTLQARLLFAPASAILCGLSVVVARDSSERDREKGIEMDQQTDLQASLGTARRSRIAATAGSVILLLTSAVHGTAFPDALAEVADPPVDQFMHDVLPGMWLFFSWHLAVVAIAVLWVSRRTQRESRTLLGFAAAVAAGDAVWVGLLAGWLFFGTLLLAVAAALLITATLRWPSTPPASTDLREA